MKKSHKRAALEQLKTLHFKCCRWWWLKRRARFLDELTDSQRADIRLYLKLFKQLKAWDMLYLYRYRKEALKLCATSLDEPAKAGHQWLFWATGAIKKNITSAKVHVRTGKPLYSWLQEHTAQKKSKKVLPKRNTKGKRKIVRR